MIKNIYPFMLIVICLAPWAVIQLFTRIPSDAAFLYLGMEMLMQGKAMSEYFYDNNPPMSFLIYAPAALIHALGVSKHFAIQIYVMSFTAISVFFTYYYLSKYKALDLASRFIIVTSYLGAVTLLSYAEYGQKDHFIAIALVPFILMQLSITNKHNTPQYMTWLSILLYVPFILVKPHFGILPVALILQRLYISKKIQINADFMGLAIGVISYLSFIYIYMPDYISEILPASLLYYLSNYTVESFTKTTIAVSLLGGALIVISKFKDGGSDAKYLCFTFAWLATLSIIAFWVQGKGFTVHLMPIITLMSIAAGQLLYPYIKKPLISILVILALFYITFSFTKHMPTKSEYEEMSLAKLLKEKAGDKPFFMESYSTNIIWTQSLYSPNQVASRFPSLWMLFGLNKLTKQEQKYTWEKYGGLIAKDIERGKPEMIALMKFDDPDKGFTAFFKNHKDFQKQWKNYKYDSEYTLSKDEYLDSFLRDNDKEIVYDIYIRQ